ncbi:hypothetical protein Tco_0976147 [Tanacetum coccineum]|uniref:Zinc finger, CCHC-type n=1 Tax=Tanacetum coccineum TaxID=301880 RepID=A0ABQ5EGF1_9ASTR
MYAMTCTRPDIAFAVGRLSKYTSNPSTQHWQAIQRVLKYLKKTMDYKLTYISYPSVLEGYTDTSWISNTEDNSSTSGWVFQLGGDAISWASKKQTCITGSTMESGFVALAAVGKEVEWLKNLLLKIPLWVKLITPISIRCDSVSTLAKAYNQMYNRKSRHLSVRHIMIRGLITNGMISIEFVRLQVQLFPPLSKHLESRSNGWECIENNNVGLSLRSNQNGGIYQGHPELEIAVLSMIGEDVYKENATRLANTGTMHNRIRRRCCAHSSEVGFIPTCSYSSFQSQSFTSSIVDSNLPHHQRKPQSSNKDHQLGRLVRLIITSCHNKLFTSYEMLVRAQVIKKVKIKMIQVREMMQDNDLKNSKSKDKGSRSRSQSMNEQSHYKQDKTKTRQSINVKSHIFNVISGTEEFEERDLNIGGDC